MNKLKHGRLTYLYVNRNQSERIQGLAIIAIYAACLWYWTLPFLGVDMGHSALYSLLRSISR